MVVAQGKIPQVDENIGEGYKMTQEEFIELVAEYYRIKKEKETNVKIETQINF